MDCSATGMLVHHSTIGRTNGSSHLPELRLFEALYLVDGEDGYWLMIPEDVVEAHPDLKWVLIDESLGGLSEPQPL